MKDEIHLALIGDVVSSREWKDRQELQERLLRMIAELNGALGPQVFSAPLTLTAGDECQALLRRPEAVVTVLQELTDRLQGSQSFPYLTFGVGFGRVATGPVPPSPKQAPNPALLDGPCFHAAREALREARKRHVWARFRGFSPERQIALDALFDLMGAIRSEWTPRQGVYSYQTRELVVQRDVAQRLGVSPSVVSESLKAAHHETIRAGENAASTLLGGVWGDITQGEHTP